MSGVTVSVSGFNRVDSNGAWSTAYLGVYSHGLGVTNFSEGNGDNNRHVVDNIGDNTDYVEFEFSSPVIVDQAYLDYIIGDSDISVWIGTKPAGHNILSDAFLASLGPQEDNNTTSNLPRWADINAANTVGNVLVISASPGGKDDGFKIRKLLLGCQGSPCGAQACVPPYPFTSTNPLTSIPFNESEVLRAARLAVDPNCAPTSLQVFYNDEHAISLGVRQVQVKTGTVTTTTNYPISSLLTNPGSAMPPLVGSTILSGDQAGTDTSGRPLFPALFITDMTANPGNPYAGDWQYGGTAIAPSAIFGTWKGAVRKVDTNTNTVTVTPDGDPAKNNWNLGPGSDPVPTGLVNQGYGAEVRWDLSTLSLISGHQYRLYFTVHDGDQNKVGGDVGQACVIFTMPGTPPPTPTPTPNPTPVATPTPSCSTITLSPATLPDGKNHQAYSKTITASGGSSPYTFTVTSGTLPAGLTLSSAGILSGTPTHDATYSFTIQAQDTYLCTGSKAYTLKIRR